MHDITPTSKAQVIFPIAIAVLVILRILGILH
jgi:hypothetical protein